MITETEKRKIEEFAQAVHWTPIDWSSHTEVKDLLAIIRTFNSDPELAILYWKRAHLKSEEAVKKFRKETSAEIGIDINSSNFENTLLHHFKNDRNAVDNFRKLLEADEETLAQEVFKANFSDVVMQYYCQHNTVQ